MRRAGHVAAGLVVHYFDYCLCHSSLTSGYRLAKSVIDNCLSLCSCFLLPFIQYARSGSSSAGVTNPASRRRVAATETGIVLTDRTKAAAGHQVRIV